MKQCVLKIIFVSFTVCSASWYPPVRRGDVPHWGPSLPPVPPPWSAPPPSSVFRRPMDSMVDLTNELGVAILQDYSHARSNFAFSPYGLASVLVVLYEGSMGESGRQIHMAAKFPWDKDVTRIGFRDIHRHLRSYFSHEGYLSGITLNKNRSTLKPDYKRILRFYGYDVDVEPPMTPAPPTKRPFVPVPIVTSPPKQKPGAPSTSPQTNVEPLVDLAGKEAVEGITQQSIVINTIDNLAPSTEKSENSTSQPNLSSPPPNTTISAMPSTSAAPTQASTTSLATSTLSATVAGVTSSTENVPKDQVEVFEIASKKNQTNKLDIQDNGMLVPQSTTTSLPVTTNKVTTDSAEKETTTETASDFPETTTSISSPIESRNAEDFEFLNGEPDASTSELPTGSTPYYGEKNSDLQTDWVYSEATTVAYEAPQNSEKGEEVMQTTPPEFDNSNYPTVPQEESTSTFPLSEVTRIDFEFSTEASDKILGESVPTEELSPKDVFKRSPPWTIRTLDEYLLRSEEPELKSSQGKNQVESVVPKESMEIFKILPPKTLDEYFFRSDVPELKSSQILVKSVVPKISLPTEIFKISPPKTLEEYFLRSDVPELKSSPPSKIKVKIVEPTENTFKPFPPWPIRTLDEYLLRSDMPELKSSEPSKNKVLKGEVPYLAESKIKVSVSRSKNEENIFKNPEWAIRTLDEYFLGNDLARKSSSPPLRDISLPNLSSDLIPHTLEEFLLKKDGQSSAEKSYPRTLEEYLMLRKSREMEGGSTIKYKTDLAFRRFRTKRKSRTITDMLHLPAVPDLSLQLQNGMFDSHVSRKAELYQPLPRQAFLVDAAAETPVPVMTYSNVFPYAYIPRLHSTALEFPLDDERYKLLIILPNERRGLRQLAFDLSEVTLRGVLDSLRPTRVKATVPTFMVEGFVILTPALQRLGIWNVFDPRRANLTAMSTDPELYVRNIEQSVTVVIRNYVEILDIQTRTMAARAVEHEFIATHPFLYFVLDTETNVALMAGQMLDPLNSRVY